MEKRGLIFLLALGILFSGCSIGQSGYPTDDTYHFETDAQYSCIVSSHQRMVAESEKGYYFALTFRGLRSMFFTDKETMKTVPLCSRPNCLHFEETDMEKRVLCQAYFIGTIGGPSLYYSEGRILIPEWGETASHYNITALDLDGASRKNLFSMKDATDGVNFLFHRGYCYVIVNTYDEELRSFLELRQYSLSQPEKKPKILFSVSANGGYLASPQAYGEHLYFYGNVDGEWQVYTVDLRTLKCRKLFGDLPIEWPALTVCQDKLYFLMIHIDPEREQYEYASTCYTAELDGSNLQKCWESGSYDVGSDGRYIYMNGPLERLYEKWRSPTFGFETRRGIYWWSMTSGRTVSTGTTASM